MTSRPDSSGRPQRHHRHLTDQVSWVKGKHQFRFGGEFRQAHWTSSTIAMLPALHLDGSQSGVDASAYGTDDAPLVSALADFLVGKTSAASITIGDPDRQVFVNTWFLNAGDSCR